MIDKPKCFEYLEKIKNDLHPDEYNYFKSYCDQGISMAELVRDEIGKACNLQAANNYIAEEEYQMKKYLGRPYDMSNISVAEHVYNENSLEQEHAHMYARVPGDVKWFMEWLEGHHPSLGCLYGQPNDVPSADLYGSIIEGAIEAEKFRNDKLFKR